MNLFPVIDFVTIFLCIISSHYRILLLNGGWVLSLSQSLALPPAPPHLLKSYRSIFYLLSHHLLRTLSSKPGLTSVVQGFKPTLILELLHIQLPTQQLNLSPGWKTISYSFLLHSFIETVAQTVVWKVYLASFNRWENLILPSLISKSKFEEWVIYFHGTLVVLLAYGNPDFSIWDWVCKLNSSHSFMFTSISGLQRYLSQFLGWLCHLKFLSLGV